MYQRGIEQQRRVDSRRRCQPCVIVGLPPERDRADLVGQVPERLEEVAIPEGLTNEPVLWNVFVRADWPWERVAIDADIELRDLVVDSERREQVDCLDDRPRRGEIDVVMHLMADTVYGHAAVLEIADERLAGTLA